MCKQDVNCLAHVTSALRSSFFPHNTFVVVENWSIILESLSSITVTSHPLNRESMVRSFSSRERRLFRLSLYLQQLCFICCTLNHKCQWIQIVPVCIRMSMRVWVFRVQVCDWAFPAKFSTILHCVAFDASEIEVFWAPSNCADADYSSFLYFHHEMQQMSKQKSPTEDGRVSFQHLNSRDSVSDYIHAGVFMNIWSSWVKFVQRIELNWGTVSSLFIWK